MSRGHDPSPVSNPHYDVTSWQTVARQTERSAQLGPSPALADKICQNIEAIAFALLGCCRMARRRGMHGDNIVCGVGRIIDFCTVVQGSAKRRAPGLVNFGELFVLVNFVPAVAYHFCLALPAAFTQPGARLLAEPCSV